MLFHPPAMRNSLSTNGLKIVGFSVCDQPIVASLAQFSGVFTGKEEYAFPFCEPQLVGLLAASVSPKKSRNPGAG